MLQVEKMNKWPGQRKALRRPFVGRQIPETGMAVNRQARRLKDGSSAQRLRIESKRLNFSEFPLSPKLLVDRAR
jgi:hypothetical protein